MEGINVHYKETNVDLGVCRHVWPVTSCDFSCQCPVSPAIIRGYVESDVRVQGNFYSHIVDLPYNIRAIIGRKLAVNAMGDVVYNTLVLCECQDRRCQVK